MQTFLHLFYMEQLDRLKLAVKTLISLGVAKNQAEIGKLMGYTNKSSFSKILNGLVPIPDKFIEKLCKLDRRIRQAWVANEIGHILIRKEDSKQVYIDEGIDIDQYDEQREIERQKRNELNPEFHFRELADARLEIIEGLKREIILKDKLIVNLETEILELKKATENERDYLYVADPGDKLIKEKKQTP